MKTTVWSLLLALTLILVGCKQSLTQQGFVVQQTTTAENISAQGTTVSIEIESDEPSWSVSSDQPWCVPQQTTASGSATISFEVAPNPEPTPRTATITLLGATGSKTQLALTQQAGDPKPEVKPALYRLPVIVHAFYKNSLDSMEFVKRGYIAEVFAQVNQIYAGKTNMDIEFVLATTAPDGSMLEEPGVERIYYEGSWPLDPKEEVGNTGRDVLRRYMWDPYQYINLYLYPFRRTVTSSGFADLPSVEKDHPLPGLDTLHHWPVFANLKGSFGVWLNGKHLYTKEKAGSTFSEFTITIAHELGHLLGLHHAFTEEENEKPGQCKDTDYCPDTPTYDRYAYQDWLIDDYYEKVPKEADRDQDLMRQRTACDGSKFVSTNVMDYYVSFSNEFTPDQRARVHHVLQYGMLLPGAQIRPKTPESKAGGSSSPRFRIIE